MKKICCFTGHRPKHFHFQYDERHPGCISLKQRLRKEILKSIGDGYFHYISGFAQGVDIWAVEIIVEMKKEIHLTLEAAIPCESQPNYWSKDYRERYYKLLVHCDIVTTLSKTFYPSCMMDRNKYMIDKSSKLIAVYGGGINGTGRTIEYAKNKGLDITIINP